MLRSPDDLLAADAPDELRRLVAYWIARAAGRPMPGLSDIDPVEIPWALSRVYVVRVVDGGADFVYRLAGAALTRRYPGSLAGRRLTARSNERRDGKGVASTCTSWLSPYTYRKKHKM